MSMSTHDRKLLWAKAGNRCSYRYQGDICDAPLARVERGKQVLVGKECHISGKRPGSSRYIDDSPDRDSYDNLILLCAAHHERIDAKELEGVYTIDVLRAMKADHECAMAERLRDGPMQPLVIEDSVFEMTAENTDKAVGMQVDKPAVLRNVRTTLRACGVHEAVGFSTNQSLSGIVATCSKCGRVFTFACTGPRPPGLPCPHCGYLN